MTHVTELAYVVYEVSDLDDWTHFGVDLLGMMKVEATADGFNLRTDERSFRWQIEQGAADDLVASGFLVESLEALAELSAGLAEAGFAVTDGDAEICAKRQVETMRIVHDPIGNRVELVTGHCDAQTPWASASLHGHFVTGQGGAGHEVLIAKGESRDEYLAFYLDLLGFKVSDQIVEELAPGIVADLIFLHCNPRHHSVALGDIPHPKRIHHFMIEVSDIRDVGLAWDRCLAAAQPVEMTIGMHPNDHMLSFYVFTPSGFSIEYGWGGLLIDDATWEPKTLEHLHWWGHQPAGAVAGQLAESAARVPVPT
ncbi:biphenyl 2,3-dioxygenase [Gordonia sp. TBRC 11910]|uniref:Biphenyl 2,3-dioxygenase n=1 Tax=Gordonia asplenii TaxID=2725283 RepID=A0A848KZJ5_9ACTN|nr:VOC family protein [Gordonia asplenii]NMO03577.1 biphenyl 2,3-dioxygenase [Gordonia asplenii]